jgi:hypothetical protein
MMGKQARRREREIWRERESNTVARENSVG